MAINSINTVTAAAAASTQTTTKSAEKTSETTKKAASSKTASGVIYEKSSDSRTDKASNLSDLIVTLLISIPSIKIFPESIL